MNLTCLKSGIWQAELRVPQEVRPVIGKTRFAKSMGTRNKRQAVLRAAPLLEQWQSDIELAKSDPHALIAKQAQRNAEQAFAIHSLLNENVSLVSINGVAGTGKTLLALASAISQRRNYKQIFVARPIVPLGNKDIGYLPGDINSKINPYMEPLWDNFKYIQNQYKQTSKEFKILKNMIESEKLVIQPLAYIRGRSFSNIFFIVDEAQNLTPHEIKTIISRAGENTKIVFAGDINQIDTPYLDSQSNGLSYLIDKLKGQKLYSHITLKKGERSDLANLANELL